MGVVLVDMSDRENGLSFSKNRKPRIHRCYTYAPWDRSIVATKMFFNLQQLYSTGNGSALTCIRSRVLKVTHQTGGGRVKNVINHPDTNKSISAHSRNADNNKNFLLKKKTPFPPLPCPLFPSGTDLGVS